MWRKLLRAICIALALLAGCRGGPTDDGLVYPAYGMPAPHDLTVTLEEFTYTPTTIRRFETLSVTGRLNKPTTSGWLAAEFVRDSLVADVWLNDYGQAPDDVANDGIWHGALNWSVYGGPAGSYEATLYLTWEDGFAGQELSGPTLTVLEDDAQ